MRTRRTAGFTLAEVVLSLFLVGIGVAAVAPLFVQGAWMTATSDALGSASAAGIQRMELLRSRAFNTLAAGGSLTSNVTGYSDASNPKVTVRWTIQDNATPATLKTITVRAIATRKVKGPQKRFEVTTLRGR
jgi:Tfp pilus assembly protein PilV